MPRAVRTKKKKKSVRSKSSTAKRGKRGPTKSLDELIDYCEEGSTVEVSPNFQDYVTLIYGESGAGKTSTASQAPGSYVIQCDPKRRGLSIRQTNIPDMSLDEMKEKSNEFTPYEVIEATLERILDDDSVQTVIFDNIKNVYQYAHDHLLAKNFYESLNDFEDFGTSWNRVDGMYGSFFKRIVEQDKGIILIAHQTEKEFDLPDGSAIERIVPDCSKRMFSSVKAITDFAFHIGFDNSGGRVITIRHDGPDPWFKCCTDKEPENQRFFDPDGNPVNRISAGDSPNEAWENILKSWNNELYDVDHRPNRTKKKKKGVKKRRRDT